MLFSTNALPPTEISYSPSGRFLPRFTITSEIVIVEISVEISSTGIVIVSVPSLILVAIERSPSVTATSALSKANPSRFKVSSETTIF